MRHPHREYCIELSDELQARRNFLQQDLAAQGDQVVIGSFVGEVVEPIEHLHASNCLFTETPYLMTEGQGITNPENTLLQFMMAATPNVNVANDIGSNFERHLSDMTITPTHHFMDDPMVMYIDNVPDTVNPVKAKMAYVQVPNKQGDSTVLNLVWKVRASFSYILFFYLAC